MVELGDQVRDKVTGYWGFVTAIMLQLLGSTAVYVETEVREDGYLAPAHWFPENRLEVTAKAQKLG